MKKSTKVLGSIALSAALAMGTAVPAFAEEDSTGTWSTDEVNKLTAGTGYTADEDDPSTGVGNTTVNISTYTSQINVTVPLKITFALDTVGGSGYAPSNYYIGNGTDVPIVVTSATATATGDYGFAAAADAKKGGQGKNGDKGDIYAVFTPKADVNENEKIPMYFKDDVDGEDQEPGWVIGAKPATTALTSISVTYMKSGKQVTEKFSVDGTGEGVDGNIAAAKTAIVTANDLKTSGVTKPARDAVMATSVNTLEALMDVVKQYSLTGVSTGDETKLEFDISAASTVLTDSADVADVEAAKIVYTIAVAK